MNNQKGGSGFSRRHFLSSVAGGATETALIGAMATAEARGGPPEASGPEAVKVTLNVNSHSHTILVEPRETLLRVLRDRLGVTGTKQGCERGECGACTVLIDGMARYACMTLALEVSERPITTVEGLMHGDQLGAVQQAFLEEDGFQCGYCTAGQIVSIEGLLRQTSDPTIEQIREGLSGNLCRCGAYAHIFRAARRAAELKKAGR